MSSLTDLGHSVRATSSRDLLIMSQSLQDNSVSAQLEKAQEEIRRFQKQHSPNTLLDFLDGCHDYLSLPLEIEYDTAKTTRGGLTSPNGRLCPTRLQHWSDFNNLQERAMESVYRLTHPIDREPHALFESANDLQVMAHKMCTRRLSSEDDLDRYETYAVEERVANATEMISTLSSSMPRKILFTRYFNTLTDSENAAPTWQDHTTPDRYCFSESEDGSRQFLYIVEYKPAHKLSSSSLRSALDHPLDIWKDVVQQVTIPTDGNDKVENRAKELTASALVQTFDNMIKTGVAYSYITNGETFVFLHVSDQDPETLHYYLAQPNMDAERAVEAELDTDENHDAATSAHMPLRTSQTAVALVLAFTLMSLGSKPRCQDWRNNAFTKLQIQRWGITSSLIFPSSSQERSPSESAGSLFYPSSPPRLSPTVRPPRRSRRHCSPPTDIKYHDDLPESDDEGTAFQLGSGSCHISSSPPVQSSSPTPKERSTDQLSSKHTRCAEFCTQQCLLGLRDRSLLDVSCPNVQLHRQHQLTDRHLLQEADLVRLMKEQLDLDLDHHCTPFGQGGYGVAFKLTCTKYGYTFVGKGTTRELWSEVAEEAAAYKLLAKAQGSAVPVFLGSIDLKMTYFFCGSEIKHMLLMSWAGNAVTPEQMRNDNVLSELRKSCHEIRKRGVIHGDSRWANYLWNPITCRVQIIDFHKISLARKDHTLNKVIRHRAHGSHQQIRLRLGQLCVAQQ